MTEKFSLKDHLFHPAKITQLAEQLTAVYPAFAAADFHAEVVAAFPTLELKARIEHIRTCLRKYLPQAYRAAVEIILTALPAPLDAQLTDDDFGDFIYAPYNDFVAHYGCTSENLSFSLAALREITQRFSAEDSIRYFLNAFPQETLAELTKWTADSHYHVRRLCSEGTRPKLPWSQKIGIAIEDALPLLNALYADNTRYVTRSVANHLNDIAKTQPELVLQTLKGWQASQKQRPAEMAFIVKHGLRTLIKNGNAEALALMGFGDSQQLTVLNLQFEEKTRIGEALSFSFSLHSAEAKEVAIDYIVYFQSKNGTLSNKKVHKLKTFSLPENATIAVEKRHPFRANMTTRPLYAGTHKIEIQVNGAILADFSFELSY